MLRKIKQELKEGKVLLTFTSLQGAGQALGMIAPLIIAKFFSPELFGSYSLAKLTVFFFLTVLISSAQTPFVVSANQEKANSGKINKAFTVQLLFFVTGLCVSAATMLAIQKYLLAFAEITKEELYFAFLAFAGFGIETFFVTLFMAMNQRIRSSLVELTFGVMTVGFVFVFYWAGAINIKNVFLIHFMSAITVAFIFIFAVDFGKLLPLDLEKQRLKDMLHFIKWLVLGATSVYFVNWGDNFVLRYFVPMDDIGRYNLGYQVFKSLIALIWVIQSYFLPFVSQHIANSSKIRDYLFVKRPKILVLGFAGIALVYAFAGCACRLIFGSAYEGSVAILRILLVGSALVLYAVFYDVVLYALNRYRFTQTVNVLQVLLNLGLDLLLVPAIGVIGAAVATVLAYFCRTIIITVYFRVKVKNTLFL